jgi:hypothetical protein
VLRVKEARLQPEAQEREAVLTSYVLKLLGQLSVLFLQGEEAPTNLRQVPNNRLKKAKQKINPRIMVRRESLSVNT